MGGKYKVSIYKGILAGPILLDLELNDNGLLFSGSNGKWLGAFNGLVGVYLQNKRNLSNNHLIPYDEILKVEFGKLNMFDYGIFLHLKNGEFLKFFTCGNLRKENKKLMLEMVENIKNMLSPK